MSRKKVIMLCQYFYPEYISSAELPYHTAFDLSQSGIEVEVLCGYPYEYLKEDTEVPMNEKLNDNLTVKRMKYSRFNKKNFIGRLLNYFSFTFFSLLNLKNFKHKDICIVYSNPPVIPLISYLAKRLYNLKIVYVSYDVYPEIAINTKVLSENSVITKMMRKVNTLVFPAFDKIVVLSSEMKEYIIKSRKVRPNSVEIIPNWEDESKIKKTDSTNVLKKDLPFLISYFGNMGTAQDMETIKKTILAFKHKQDISFLFAGHGNKKDELRTFITSQQLANVNVVDFLHGNQLNEKMNSSDVLLVSLEPEISGLAVPSKTYSYLAMGKPTIAIMDSKMEIAQELERYEAGFSVQNNDVEKLVLYIENLKNDKKLYESMSNNAYDLYKSKYTRKIGTEKYRKMIEKI